MTTCKIVLIGAGNIATQLGVEFHKKGFCVTQVYSRTTESAKTLARKVDANYTTSIAEINTEADVYICALKDDALPAVLNELPPVKGIIVHTAGSVNMSIFENRFEKYGVFYPLQTFSKNKEVIFSDIPIFIEANNKKTTTYLQTLAASLSEKVYKATSDQRKKIHLAAVFACNFVNHMYVIADDIVKETGFDFDILLPLIDETARKVHQLDPLDAQTGPAVRFDKTVIDKHLALLKDNEKLLELYNLISKSIHECSKK